MKEWNSESSEYLLHRNNGKKKKKFLKLTLYCGTYEFPVPVKFILLDNVRYMFGLKVLFQRKWFYDIVPLSLSALLLYRHCRQELFFSLWRARDRDIALYALFLKPSIFLTEFWNKKAKSLVLKYKNSHPELICTDIDVWIHIYI